MSALPDVLPPLQPEAPPPPRRGLAVGLIFGGCLVAVSGYLAWQRIHPAAPVATRPVRTVVVRRGTLPILARVAGSTSARRFANITAPKLTVPESDRPMTLLMLASPGDQVRRGQVVARFDPQSTTDHLDDTRDTLHARNNTLALVRAQLDLEAEVLVQNLRKAKGKVDKARLDLRTAEVRSQIQVERFRLAAAEAEAEYAALAADLPLRLAAQSSRERIYELSTEIEGLHVRRHEGDLAKLSVHAPVEGMVVLRQMHRHDGGQDTYAVGDRLSPGSLFMQVVDTKTMQVEGMINQSESGQFRIGQRARIHLDAYPGADYDGRVYAIGALATAPGRQSPWLRTIPIRLQIENSDAQVLPDLTASAEIVVDQVEDALLVPAEALIEENGRHFVDVRKGETTERRAVTPARIHGNRAALREGVEEGEVVVVPNN